MIAARAIMMLIGHMPCSGAHSHARAISHHRALPSRTVASQAAVTTSTKR